MPTILVIFESKLFLQPCPLSENIVYAETIHLNHTAIGYTRYSLVCFNALKLSHRFNTTRIDGKPIADCRFLFVGC